MSRVFLEDFDRRRIHVKSYVAAVKIFEGKAVESASRYERDRLHVMRAGLFLVIYNLVEASMRGALEAIHEEMSSNGSRFEELRESLRREVVAAFKRNATPERHWSMTNVPVELVGAALDAEHRFNGNVDARLIREVATIYGFSSETEYVRTHRGRDLLTIKTNRNDLAHGLKSYDEVGRDHSLRDLLGISLRATRHMEGILTNVDDYLEGRAYLAAAAPPSALPT